MPFIMEMLLHRLHLKYKIATSSERVLRIEDATIRLKCSALLLPAVLVKPLEVISPLEIELILLIIVAVHLDIVKEHVPRHIFRSQVSAPRMESRGPKVHFQVLGLVHVLDCFVVVGVEISDLIAVHGESDIAGCPLDRISMPVTADGRTSCIGVVLDLVVAVTVDGIGR